MNHIRSKECKYHVTMCLQGRQTKGSIMDDLQTEIGLNESYQKQGMSKYQVTMRLQ